MAEDGDVHRRVRAAQQHVRRRGEEAHARVSPQAHPEARLADGVVHLGVQPRRTHALAQPEHDRGDAAEEGQLSEALVKAAGPVAEEDVVGVVGPEPRASREQRLRSEVNIELNFPPKLRGGSFSAVSTPIFASKYALESSRRDLHNAILCTVL